MPFGSLKFDFRIIFGYYYAVMLASLTPRQKQILEFIEMYTQMHNLSPSLEEIRSHFNLKAISTVHEHIEKLKKKGYLHKEMNQARGIRTVGQEDLGDNTVSINVLGQIAAGEPIEAIEVAEPIEISSQLLPKGATGNRDASFYALKVQGDSMIEDGIHSGDIVVVKSQSAADNGDTVVAILEDNCATLKRFYREKDRVRLQPANEKLEPRFYRNVEVRGKVVALVRRYDTA